MAKKTENIYSFEQVLKRVNFQDLEIFEAVGRLGSVVAVSREKRVQSPFVSKSIKRLEDELGLSLFIRSTKGLALTVEGSELMQLYLKLTQAIHSVPWTLGSNLEEAPKKLLTLAGTSFIVNNIITQMIPELPCYPSLRFRLFEALSTDLVANGIDGLFEGAFHTSKLDWPRSWSTIPVGHLDWILCARVDHPLGTNTHEKEVKKFPFVVPSYHTDKGFKHGNDYCPLSIKDRKLGDEVGKAEIGLQLVSKTDQLIFVPKVAAQSFISSAMLQEIKVQQWSPIREALYLSIHQEKISQRMLHELTHVMQKVIVSKL